MIKFENSKASFTVTVPEDVAWCIDQQARRQKQTFERCAGSLIWSALCDVKNMGVPTWEGIRELEARSVAG